MRSRALFLFFSLLAILLPGCGGKTIDASAVSTLKPISAFHLGDPLTEDEVKQFAAELERVAGTGNENSFLQLFDWEALLERATTDLPVSGKLREDFLAGARKGAARLGKDIADRLDEGGTYQLLRVHEVDGQKRALFRLVEADSSVNYHDLLLARRLDGVKVIDVEVMASGESLALTARRFMLPVVIDNSRSTFGRWFNSNREFYRAAARMKEMDDLIREGKYARALDVESLIPESARREKVVLLLRLRAARELEDEDSYRAAMADFRAWHPDSPCLDLVSIDHHILTGEYDEALACIDRLDKAVGGDVYLHVLRTGVYLEAGRLPAARGAARAAIDASPNQADGYWAMVLVTLREKKFAETMELLQTLQKKFETDVEDLMWRPEYTEFFRSAEYLKWAEEEKKKLKKP